MNVKGVDRDRKWRHLSFILIVMENHWRVLSREKHDLIMLRLIYFLTGENIVRMARVEERN